MPALGAINIPVGPAILEYGEGADMVTFAHTKGGIKFKSQTTIKNTTIDQFGDTPVASRIKGRTAEVEAPSVEYDLEKFAKAIPNSKLFVDSVDPTKRKLEVYAGAGYNLMKDAKKLVVKPTDPLATKDEWITIPKAVATTDLDSNFDPDNERITKITFIAYPEDTDVLFYLGDEAVTVTTP